jgi:hypothetical protein
MQPKSHLMSAGRTIPGGIGGRVKRESTSKRADKKTMEMWSWLSHAHTPEREGERGGRSNILFVKGRSAIIFRGITDNIISVFPASRGI